MLQRGQGRPRPAVDLWRKSANRALSKKRDMYLQYLHLPHKKQNGRTVMETHGKSRGTALVSEILACDWGRLKFTPHTHLLR